MEIYTNDLVKGHSDVKVKCLTFGLYTQVSDSGPLGPLVYIMGKSTVRQAILYKDRSCILELTVFAKGCKNEN